MLNDYLLIMLALPAAGAVYLISVVLGKIVVGLINWFTELL
jgi:hypothetical protein